MELLDSARSLASRCLSDSFITGALIFLFVWQLVLPFLLSRCQVLKDLLKDRYGDTYTISSQKVGGWVFRLKSQNSVYAKVVVDLLLLGITRVLGPWPAVVLACLWQGVDFIGNLIAARMAFKKNSEGANSGEGSETLLTKMKKDFDDQLECEVNNRYQDLLTPSELILAIFTAQAMLLVILLQSVGRPLVKEGGTLTAEMYNYWILGVLVQLTADSQLGGDFTGSEGPYWYLLLTRSRSRTHSVKVRTAVGLLMDMEWPYYLEMVVRFVFSLLVNQVFREILRMIIPLVLVRTHDNMSFVKDAVAVLFIVSLDDLPVPKKLQYEKIGYAAPGDCESGGD